MNQKEVGICSRLDYLVFSIEHWGSLTLDALSEVLHNANGMEHDRLRLYALKLAVGTLRNFKNSRSNKVQNSLVST